MSLSTALLRLTSSSFLTKVVPRSSPSPILRHGRLAFSVRFLSAKSSDSGASRRSVRPVRARRKEKGTEQTGGDGALIVKEKENGRVVSTELHKEATDAYMAYAMSVLLGRALPDVRDGLKPVHRRIL
jgi:DNA gyrase subunit A